jgi:PAS domain S-box-containing protein
LSTITPVFQDGSLVAIASITTDLTDRREAEEAMRRLSFIVESSFDAIVGTDLEGCVTSWNGAAEQLYGYSSEEAIGNDVLDLVTSGEDGGYDDVLSRWRAGDLVELDDFPARRKNGDTVEIYVTVSPVRDASGSVIGSASIARDVTARTRLERAAEEDRRRLTEAQEVAQLGSFELDPATGSMEWSQSYRRLLGVKADEAASVGLFLDRVHPEDREQAEADIGEAMHADGSFAGTFRIVRTDSEVRWLQVRTRAMKDKADNLYKVIGTAIDVTDRHRMEAARREAEERFRLGFERGAVATAIVDLDGIVTSVNPVMCGFLERPEADLVGQPAQDFVHPEDRGDPVTRGAVYNGDRLPTDQRFLHGTGKPIWGLVNVALVRSDDGTPAYYYVQVQDITERKAAEQMLEHMALHDPLTALPNRRSTSGRRLRRYRPLQARERHTRSRRRRSAAHRARRPPAEHHTGAGHSRAFRWGSVPHDLRGRSHERERCGRRTALDRRLRSSLPHCRSRALPDGLVRRRAPGPR